LNPVPTDDVCGWLPIARRVPSPNCDARPANVNIELVVIHAISLPPDEFGGHGVVELFTNCLDPRAHPYYETVHDLRVSAHFLIRRDGELLQFVSCSQRAWHAGVSSWRGRGACNDFSLGIELEGCDSIVFTDSQYAVLNRLIEELRARYPIVDVVGHSDIAPGRKTDPGPCFEWARLNRQSE